MRPGMKSRRDRRSEEGQIIVLFALAAVAMIAMVGLVIDGGGVFAQRRAEQNGADLAAVAGANAYMNTPGVAATRRAAAITAANAVASRNGYVHGTDNMVVTVAVDYLASGANVTVGVGKPHRNSFASIVPGQASWTVTVTATAVAGVIDTAVGAAPWTMNINAFNPDGTPKYGAGNPQDFGESNGDYPTSALDIAWTDFNGFNNVNSAEVKAIIDGSNVVTATFDFQQYLGQHNQGNHTTLFGDVDNHLAGHDVPIPIVGPGPCQPNGQVDGCFKGWAMFHVISAAGGSSKTITGYFTGNFKTQPLTVGECTPAQAAAGQCGDIPNTAFDNKIVRLTN
jgi:Flp pilus assembly protein TadG